jgi:hypothetical protein
VCTPLVDGVAVVLTTAVDDDDDDDDDEVVLGVDFATALAGAFGVFRRASSASLRAAAFFASRSFLAESATGSNSLSLMTTNAAKPITNAINDVVISVLYRVQTITQSNVSRGKN